MLSFFVFFVQDLCESFSLFAFFFQGLRPLANTDESWCQGLDGLAERAATYYEQGARFCKWRSVVSIPNGPTRTAVTDCAYGLARYAAICQNAGLVPIVEVRRC